MSEVTMPRLSDMMEEGTVLRWLKREGEVVRRDEELVEVETDKATVTVPSEFEGLVHIIVAEATTVAVGTVIAEVSAAAAATQPEASAPPRSADAAPPCSSRAQPASANGAEPASLAGSNDRRPRATPLARRAARAHGVELEELAGTGPRGRITRDDVLAAAGIHSAAAPPVDIDSAARPTRSARELTRIQRLIATRMSDARASIPEFEVETEVGMDAALALREQLREALREEAVPSLNDLIVKACALSLRAHPRLNATWEHERVILHESVNIGFATAAEDLLVVPTVENADARSLAAIAAETRRLAARARGGTISPAELSGATFTVSNLGMYGMSAIRPIINAPQVAILGAGAVRETVALHDGEVVGRKLMTLTLSCDHRAVYGADAARFLSAVSALLETPLGLLL